MWEYQQSTGRLLAPDGTLAATGYAGFGVGKNNPALQDQIGIGPIPRGVYTIGPPQYVPPAPSGPHGPYVLRLTPDAANEMFHRSGFLIHGDSIASPGTASHGCIIVGRAVRERMGAARLSGGDNGKITVSA